MQDSGQQNPPNQQNPYPNQNPYPPQQPYQVPPPNDGFAITSMVLGIIAVLTCYFGIILGTVAVIFGHISLGKMKRDPNIGGKGMAIAGLATGYVGIAASIVTGIFFLFAASTAGVVGSELIEKMEQQVEKERIRAEKKEEQERLRNEREAEKEDARELIPDQQ